MAAVATPTTSGPKSHDLTRHGITNRQVYHNAEPAVLYEHAIVYDESSIVSSGALATHSGAKTGRCPKDKRIVEQAASRGDIWWGDVNIPMDEASFLRNRQRAIDYLNICRRVYVVDGFAGWDPRHQVKVRVICARPYHALFMRNMLIRPTAEQLDTFGQPDYVIFNAGQFPADPRQPPVTSSTSIALSFERGEFVILGTQYAGEMKKGVFTIMNYLMPKRGVLSMHCSANEGAAGDVALFFGLSGTGKTTLSANPSRALIGDDEHCWSDDGVFNIEGGCYAKCIHLSAEREPEIFQAIRFGTVLENVVHDPETRQVDFDDDSLTENTRASYPIEFIPHAKIPCVGGHPRAVIFLTCDAFGVLPPVARLTRPQAMYHFLNGYTAKMAGTEVGVLRPQATFSAGFGAAFLVWHPTKYATLLAEKMEAHGAQCWLVNTGWSGGSYGVGSRIKLSYTRAIIDAIHQGVLANVPMVEEPMFGLMVPRHCPGVPDNILLPELSWTDKAAYGETARHLAHLFHEHFELYRGAASAEVIAAADRHGAGG